jgi:hypothetical protein
MAAPRLSISGSNISTRCRSPTHRSCPPTGHLVVFQSPDGLYLRVLTLPEGGIQSIEMNRDVPEPQGAWMAPDIMRRP